jgi:hypothetical protein
VHKCAYSGWSAGGVWVVLVLISGLVLLFLGWVLDVCGGVLALIAIHTLFYFHIVSYSFFLCSPKERTKERGAPV